MRLFPRLWQVATLLSALLSVSLAADAATHDGLRKLTAANFTLTEHGAWLIEFFSPACSHCKKFGPTWSELAQNKDSLRTQYPDAPFTMAQVDCLAQWDVCKEQGVQFLPRLTLYQDGQQHSEEYKGNRNYPEISAYIDKFAAEYRKSKGVSDVASTSTKAADAQTTTGAAETGTEASTAAAVNTEAAAASTTIAAAQTTATEAEALVLPSGPNPKGELMSYGSDPIKTPEELKQWLDASSDQGPTFVKFFAPWCPHCKAMAAAYKEVATSLKGRVNVLEVDCEANRAICSSYGVRGYPHLRMYNKGQAKDYNGGRNHDAMLKWALKAASSTGLKPVSSATELSALAKEDEVVFLYLHSPGTSEVQIEAVDAASQVLFGSRAQVAVSSESSLLDRYASSLMQDKALSVPATSGLLVFKDHSVTQPTSVLYPSTIVNSSDGTDDRVKEEISKWLSQQKYALLTELTAANFEETVRNKDDALVVLAALSDTTHFDLAAATSEQGIAQRDEELRVLRSLALEWRETQHTRPQKEVVWAWIDADRWKSPLKKLYGIKPADLPALVLVDGHHLQYYSLPRENSPPWLTSASLFAGIVDAAQGKVPARSSRTLLQKSVRGAGQYSTTLINACVDHPYAAFGFLFGLNGALIFWLRRTRKASAGGQTSSSLPMYTKVSTVKAD